MECFAPTRSPQTRWMCDPYRLPADSLDRRDGGGLLPGTRVPLGAGPSATLLAEVRSWPHSRVHPDSRIEHLRRPPAMVASVIGTHDAVLDPEMHEVSSIA